MKYVAGVDIGNATTEVALAKTARQRFFNVPAYQRGIELVKVFEKIGKRFIYAKDV